MIEMYDIGIKKRISKQTLGYIMMNSMEEGNGNMSLRESKNKILNSKWKACSCIFKMDDGRYQIAMAFRFSWTHSQSYIRILF